MLTQQNGDSEKVYWLKDPTWFAPINVIHHYIAHLDSLPDEQKGSKTFRKADELFIAAIALLGIQQSESEQYWMQPVSDAEQSPDVRTGRWLPMEGDRAPDFQMQDIEVVTFVPHDKETLPEFLKRTKLSEGSSYDAKTTILCYMQTGAPTPTAEIVKELENTGAVCPVLVLGHNHPTEKKYALLQVYPHYKVIAAYDMPELLKKQTHTGVLNLRRGSRPSNERRPEEKYCPFQSTGFTCPIIDQTDPESTS